MSFTRRKTTSRSSSSGARKETLPRETNSPPPLFHFLEENRARACLPPLSPPSSTNIKWCFCDSDHYYVESTQKETELAKKTLTTSSSSEASLLSFVSNCCEDCRKEGATKRCMKCRTCFYCDRECQRKNWKKLHKRVCTTKTRVSSPARALIEMAIERVLRRLPSQATAPAEATCYICLDHDSKLVYAAAPAQRRQRPSFVHVESTRSSSNGADAKDDYLGRTFLDCVNCTQDFTGALQLELSRRWWRLHREESVKDSKMFFSSATFLADILGTL